MNKTIKEQGLVPSRHVLGVMEIFSIISTQLPGYLARMEVLVATKAEMNAFFAERKITTALFISLWKTIYCTLQR